MKFDIERIRPLFEKEVRKQLLELKKSISGLKGGHHNKNLELSHRIVHTMKSSAASMGADKLSEVALEMEKILFKILEEKSKVNNEVIHLLDSGRQVMALLLNGKEVASSATRRRGGKYKQVQVVMRQLKEMNSVVADFSHKKNKLKILVADDSLPARKLVIAILHKAGYIVREAKDGQEVLKKIEQEVPDIILLDVIMPKMDGYQVCRKIREDIILRNIPIIMLTAEEKLDNVIKGLQSGSDDYVIKPFSPHELLARIEMVVRRISMSLDCNPLTKLPGNISINKEIETKIACKDPYAVLFFDLNNFKAFNDLYGYKKGDKVICETARIIIKAIKSYGNSGDFLGHIGGDDFVALSTPDKIKLICSDIISDFDTSIISFYGKKEQKMGYIISKNRKDKIEKFPIMGISISVVTNLKRKFTHPAEVGTVNAQLKKFAKSKQKSCYVVDRRKVK